MLGCYLSQRCKEILRDCGSPSSPTIQALRRINTPNINFPTPEWPFSYAPHGFRDTSILRIPQISAGQCWLVNRLNSPAQKTETETVKIVYKCLYTENVGALERTDTEKLKARRGCPLLRHDLQEAPAGHSCMALIHSWFQLVEFPQSTELRNIGLTRSPTGPGKFLMYEWAEISSTHTEEF
ncbi:hypothetical protein B0H13DRAFT_1893183 [Mycena leptocephala]|nr:hypothetical protein B0H13DRAFT_1893183 [Mycena leptocephala]